MLSLKTVFVLIVCLFAAGCNLWWDQRSNEPITLSKPKSASLAKNAVLQAPKWSVGDTWKYSDGYSITVSKTLADGRTMFNRADNSHWFTRRGFFREEYQTDKVRRLVVYRAPNPLKLFPANHQKQVSFIREYMRNDKLVRHRTSWQMEKREKITVPAGTFDTWVLVWRSNGLDSNWRGYERWYYSPAVKNYVRLEYKYGDSAGGSRVLMSFDLTDK